jgi:arabinose-5-phosphate isomerase
MISSSSTNKCNKIDTARSVIDSAIEGLNALSLSLDSNFTRLIEEILQHKGRVMVSGMGKSGHIAKKISATLSSTGTPAFFIHPGEASHGDLGMIQPDDLVILLSNSGETAELKDIINYCKRFHIFLVAMVRQPNSSLGLAADICLNIPNIAEALEFDAPTTSTSMMLALGDAIALTLLENKGFSRKDFQLYHPGGRLGASFYRVKDVMHVDYELPIVQFDSNVEEALAVITQKKFGCTAVLDNEQKLAGIFTDGELRRSITIPDLLSRNITQVMKRNPLTIDANSLVVEALDIMNKNLITCLFVVDEHNYLKGIVHMHDCLKVGATPELK